MGFEPAIAPHLAAQTGRANYFAEGHFETHFAAMQNDMRMFVSKARRRGWCH